MKRQNTHAGKAFADGFAKGREHAREEAADTIRKLKEALNKALAENLKLRTIGKLKA